MNFPIHVDDLGGFVTDLRSEGFDARTDLFNGQVGLIIGPNGLDPSRMPPKTAGLFFPLWELNYTVNRALVKVRKFHEIFESRPQGWQSNRPYQNQGEQERINLRHWNRSASLSRSAALLGKRHEELVQQELIRLFPPSDFPVNIDVVGSQAQTFVTVRVTNIDAGINEEGVAVPEDFLRASVPVVAAVIDSAERIITQLQGTRRIPVAPLLQPPMHKNFKLSLRAIARAGDGPDVTKWDQVVQYEVDGLPQGQRAWIANFGGREQESWRILRAHNEVQSDWTGDYTSAENALAVLQKAFDPDR